MLDFKPSEISYAPQQNGLTLDPLINNCVESECLYLIAGSYATDNATPLGELSIPLDLLIDGYLFTTYINFIVKPNILIEPGFRFTDNIAVVTVTNKTDTELIGLTYDIEERDVEDQILSFDDAEPCSTCSSVIKPQESCTLVIKAGVAEQDRESNFFILWYGGIKYEKALPYIIL